MCDYIGSIVHMDIDIVVSEEKIVEWSDEVMKIDFRIRGHPEPVCENLLVVEPPQTRSSGQVYLKCQRRSL